MPRNLLPCFDRLETIVLDFDGTLVDSISAYCAVYSVRYGHHRDFVFPDPEKVTQWDLKDQCPLESNPESVFKDPLFFEFLVPYKGALAFLEEAKKEYDVWVCSIGTPGNIILKTEWVKKCLHHDQMIMIAKTGASMGKDFVYFDNAVIVDDHQKNLCTSRIRKKICFGKEYEWNKEWEGFRAYNMQDLSDLLLRKELQLDRKVS